MPLHPWCTRKRNHIHSTVISPVQLYPTIGEEANQNLIQLIPQNYACWILAIYHFIGLEWIYSSSTHAVSKFNNIDTLLCFFFCQQHQVIIALLLIRLFCLAMNATLYIRTHSCLNEANTWDESTFIATLPFRSIIGQTVSVLILIQVSSSLTWNCFLKWWSSFLHVFCRQYRITALLLISSCCPTFTQLQRPHHYLTSTCQPRKHDNNEQNL